MRATCLAFTVIVACRPLQGLARELSTPDKLWPTGAEPRGTVTVQTGGALCETFQVRAKLQTADPADAQSDEIERRIWTIKLVIPSNKFLNKPPPPNTRGRTMCAVGTLIEQQHLCGAGGWEYAFDYNADKTKIIVRVSNFGHPDGPVYAQGRCTRFREEDVAARSHDPEVIAQRDKVCAAKQPQRAALGNELIRSTGIYLYSAFDKQHPAEPRLLKMGPLLHEDCETGSDSEGYAIVPGTPQKH